MKFTLVDSDKRKKSVYLLFLVVFYTDLFLGLFPAWTGSFIYKYLSQDTFMNIWLLGSLFTYLLGSILILLYQKALYNKVIVFTICFLYSFFAVSIAINGFRSGGLALWGIPISYFVLFDTLKQYRFSAFNLNLIFYVLLIWCISPLIYYALAPMDVKILFFSGLEGQSMTFSGFALHRNFYGILVGITIILLLLSRIRIVYKSLLFILLLVVLYLSACRTAMIAVAGSVLYMLLATPKIRMRKKFLLLLFSLIAMYALYYFTTNPDFALRRATDNDDRAEIWNGFFKIISDNPWFGIGEEAKYFSSSFPGGAIAHNFLLQTVANYGFFVLFFFLLLLLEVFISSKFYFRIFLLYVIIWGLFQPYFGFTIPSVHIFIPLFIGHLLDGNDTEKYFLKMY